MPASMSLALGISKKRTRHGGNRAGPRPVQLRHPTALTSDQYVTEQAWRTATLERCPLHPEESCGFARHTTYSRVEPPGMQVARYYCRRGHTTFSLLPDCLA